MGTDIGRDWMTIRRDNTTGALVTAYEEGLTGFTVASREGKRVTLQGGDTFTEFVSCSYLGLETHPALIEAARQAMVVGDCIYPRPAVPCDRSTFRSSNLC